MGARSEELEALVPRVVAGEADAWHELWRRVEPLIWGLTGKWQVSGPLCRDSDDRREIVLRVMERLRDGQYRRLRALVDAGGLRHPGAFRAWLATVTTRVAIDAARSHPECVDPRGRRAGPRFVELVPLSASAEPELEIDAVRLAMASRMLDSARALLTHQQMSALALWLDGFDAGGIAAQLSLADANAATRVVRAALKRLRDRHREGAVAEAEDLP